MGRCIIHHEGVFNVWSTVVEAAIYDPMTEAEIREWLKRNLSVADTEWQSIDSRIAHAKQYGTTMVGDKSLADTVCCNAMGPLGGRVSVKRVIEMALTLPKNDERKGDA